MTTQEVILQAAADEFAQSGYQRTSMDKIAAAAALSKGALYYFYKNKAELFLAVVSQPLDHMTRELERIIDGDISPRVMIYKIIQTYVDICLDNPQFATTLLDESTRTLDRALAEEIRKITDKLSAHFKAMLQTGEQYGVIKPCNRDVVTMIFWGALRGLLSGLSQSDAPPARQEITDTLCMVLCDGLRLGE